MMDWEPISEEELATLIAEAVNVMEPQANRLWNLIRMPPVKWAQHPWGDLGGGFWVVGVMGSRVVWYNDIEDGFNVSTYSTPGVFDDYWCNQDELQHSIDNILRLISDGEEFGSFGPPEPLT